MKTINYKGKGEHSVNELELIIEQQAEELHLLKSGQKQLPIHGVVVSLPTEEQLISELDKTLDKLKDHEMKLFRHRNYQRGYDAGFISAYEFIKDR